MSGPFLAKIRLYPVKSLDFVEVQEARIGVHSLLGDRVFAMLDANGELVNGKRTGRVNGIAAAYDLTAGTVTLGRRGAADSETFHLRDDRERIEAWLSAYFGAAITLEHRTDGSLLDIPRHCSVSVVSTASFEALLPAFPEMELEQLRARFRVNLEIGGTEAFFEDKLYGEPGTHFRFRVGDVEMQAHSPRQRCNVPPRHPHTGDLDKTFVRRFLAQREATAVPDSHLLAYDGGYYQLTVNSYVGRSQIGKSLIVGAPVRNVA